MASEVNSQDATPPLLGYLFMAGYMYVYLSETSNHLTKTRRSDAISFHAIFVWCGFQTGNFAQVSVVWIVLVFVC